MLAQFSNSRKINPTRAASQPLTTKENMNMTTSYTAKAKEMNISRISVKGARWFQRTYGNTYHTTYISALIGDTWVEIGSTEIEYGYGDQYLCTAGKWLIENGFIDPTPAGTLKDGYQLNSYEFREANNIDHYVVDVKRKKDM